MIAYRVLINGKLVATIGQPDMSVLNAGVVTSRGNEERGIDDRIRLPLGGLSHVAKDGYPRHFRWKDYLLTVGDKVEIEIIESDDVDAPIKRFRSDKIVQENPFTDEEIREMRYKDYIELKKEFGGEGDA